MSEFSSGKKDAPAVVDIRDGWKFGFSGTRIKKALYEKIGHMESEIYRILSQLENEVGSDPKDFVALLVAVHTSTPNTKARYVKTLVDRVVELQTERDRLTRAAAGFSASMIYVVDEQDLEDLGL